MKKKYLCFYCIIVFAFCQCSTGVSALSANQKEAIITGCPLINTSLRDMQRQDAIARVYFGNKFETILSKYIKPLNMKLIENNSPDKNLNTNQVEFAKAEDVFRSDYTKYQRALEELVNIDCENAPEAFYDKLLVVRERRQKMSQDIAAVKKVALENVMLVTMLRSNL